MALPRQALAVGSQPVVRPGTMVVRKYILCTSEKADTSLIHCVLRKTRVVSRCAQSAAHRRKVGQRGPP